MPAVGLPVESLFDVLIHLRIVLIQEVQVHTFTVTFKQHLPRVFSYCGSEMSSICRFSLKQEGKRSALVFA